MIPPLDVIAANLEALEETIIARLIDRAQFAENTVAYEKGKSNFEGDKRSLFDLRLRAQEEMDAFFGRYCMPEERPFTADLPDPWRKVDRPETGLMVDDYDRVSVACQILEHYLSFVGRLCKEGDDEHYGSSVEHDVSILQATARRIHYGARYVAESKFRGKPKEYTALIEEKNTDALMQLLTRREVEERILERVQHERQSCAQS